VTSISIAMDDTWHVPHRRTLELTASANVEVAG
jgi:hypothetical protein